MSQSAGDWVTATLRLVRPLGAGGMGTVWIARHLGLNSDVVVKFITGELAHNPEAVARFQREAAAASEVRSPHVVQIFDHGVSHGGLPYIAMELLEGEDLASRVARVGRLPPHEVAGVVVQVAKALSRAHEKHIVHRDIKPENIFLCETGDDDAFVKVLDFGIAKVTSADGLSGTATGAMIGSPYWMSPEQIVGAKTIDHRTDLWSLGVVAFHALTAARPFDADTIGGLAVQICSKPLSVPSQRAPNLPHAIDAWFARACAREPAHRFPTAKAMADALVAATGGAQLARVASRTSASVLPVDRQPVDRAIAAQGESGVPARTFAPLNAGIEDGYPAFVPMRSRVWPLVLGAAAVAALLGLLTYALTLRLRAPDNTQPNEKTAAANTPPEAIEPAVESAAKPPATEPEPAQKPTKPPAPPEVPAKPAAATVTTAAKAKASFAPKPPTTATVPAPPKKPIHDEPLE